MSEIKTIEKELDFLKEAIIVVREKVEFNCSIANDKAKGLIVIAYKPNDKLLEFVSFRNYLRNIKTGYAEEVAAKIRDDFVRAVNPRDYVLLLKVKAPSHGDAIVILESDLAYVSYYIYDRLLKAACMLLD